MKSVTKIRTSYCQLCGKSPQSGNNRPKSLHKTKRVIKPNLHFWNGFVICNRCRKTINTKLAKAAA